MKVNVNYARKAGRENYGSEGFSLAIEHEVPPEVAQDREKLGRFIASVFQEVKARVEEQVAGAGRRESVGEQPEPESQDVGSRRSAPARGAVRPFRRPASNGHSPAAANGRATPTGEVASVKQISYLRSLARDAGYSNDQLAMLAEEVIGRSCPPNAMTKREASLVIESLKANAA